MPRRILNALSRALSAVSRARTLGQLEKIDRSPAVRALQGNDSQVFAAAASDRLVTLACTDQSTDVSGHGRIDYNQPVPPSGA